jgi:DNA-binding CsgD family transcriptional regulator
MMAFPVAAPARSSAGSWAHEDLVALILRDDTQPLSLPPRAIAELFGLTGAEASLAAALCDGASVNQFADKRGISVGTARIHLKRILGKLDSPRQADLVRKLCGSVIAQVRRTQ